MSENWKPGDVAMAVKNGAEEHRAFLTEDLGWVCLNGIECHPDTVRRLVVIDPENREQVERLDALIDAGLSGKDSPKWAGPADILQAALREFANPTPPKPEEPTGLGAVVEDSNGDRWMLGAPTIADFNWINAADPRRSRAWRNIAAVRVLSEGVTND